MSLVISEVLAAPRQIWRRFAEWLHDRMPKGLYARALLIILVPIVRIYCAL